MQVHNVNLPITVTGRHVEVTQAMRDYAQKKLQGLHLDYPRIIDAKVILDVQSPSQPAEGRNHPALREPHRHRSSTAPTGDIYLRHRRVHLRKLTRRMRASSRRAC